MSYFTSQALMYLLAVIAGIAILSIIMIFMFGGSSTAMNGENLFSEGLARVLGDSLRRTAT